MNPNPILINICICPSLGSMSMDTLKLTVFKVHTGFSSAKFTISTSNYAIYKLFPRELPDNPSLVTGKT